MPSHMLDDELCWALDEGFLQKMAVLIRRIRWQIRREGLRKMYYRPFVIRPFFHNAATPWVLLEQVIFTSVKQSG